MQRSDPYERYARHYDAIGQSGFGQRSIINLLRYLDDRAISPKSILDVACGTGVVAVEMARRGLLAYGLDRSQAMLKVAGERALRSAVEVTWIEADMTDFILAEPVELCTCFYDAVNYIASPAEIAGFASSCFGALQPGGVLAFDINTIRKLSEGWDDFVVVAADNDERFLVYQSHWDSETSSSPLRLTGFERRKDGGWDRFDEEHIEHGFAIADLRGLLGDAGFVDIEVLRWGEGGDGDLLPGSEADFRVLFIARRPDERSSKR
jgi:2-polyprenyl-3-methyl-5-hydroxy-6-metoxy-1,4-benzoquinol methylase